MNFPNFDIENSYNVGIVAGIDEAGRGPLCGDVFAGCVILDRNNIPEGINDSKQISESKREKIFDNMIELEKEGKLFYGVGRGSVEEIEELNIRNATKLAMKRSYENLVEKYKIKVNVVIVDGNFVPNIDVKSDFVIKGDQKSLSIAGASIIAKVSRDRVLRIMDKEFPQYNWINNKGYGTKQHLDAIKQYGLTKYHRKSFIHI